MFPAFPVRTLAFGELELNSNLCFLPPTVESIAAEGLTPKNLALLAKKLLIEPKEYFEALFTKMVWTLEPHSSDSSEPITFRPHKAPAPNAHAHDRAVANEVSFKPIESIMKAYGLRVHAKEEPKVEFDLALGEHSVF